MHRINKDGTVKVTISANLTAEQLRHQIGELCEAHAQLTGQRGGKGRPLFAAHIDGVTDFMAQGVSHADGRQYLRLGYLTPFGWIVGDIEMRNVFRVIGAIGTHCADWIEATDAQREVSSGSAAPH